MRRKEEESVLSEKERGREWVKRERERNRVGEEKKSWDEEKSYENPKRGEENKKEEGREGERKKPRGGGGGSADRGGPQVLSWSRFIAGLTLPCIYILPTI